jgi:hypothetical protein
LQFQGYGRCMTRTATPWGPATLVEQLRLPQQAGDKRFASVVELLENDRGERLVRFAYSTDGTTRRGPVTLRARDVARLRKELTKRPALAAALGEAFDAGAVKNGAVKSGALKSGALKSGALKSGALKSGALKSGALKSGGA